MASNILLVQSFYESLRVKTKQVSYCIESPSDVLRELFPLFEISGFKNLSIPTIQGLRYESGENSSGVDVGLQIKLVNELPGAVITGRLSDIDLSKINCKIDGERSLEDTLRIFEKTAYVALQDSDGHDIYVVTDFDGCMSGDPEQSRKLQRNLQQVKELGKLILPEGTDVDRILRKLAC